MARPSNLSRLSIAQLQAEIQRRQSAVPKLLAARKKAANAFAKAEKRLAKIDAQILAEGGTVSAVVTSTPARAKPGPKPAKAGKRGARVARGKGGLTLVEAIYGVLKGKTMEIKDIMTAVKGAGYKTNSPNFRVMVNQTLVASKNKKMFKRVGRGEYTAI